MDSNSRAPTQHPILAHSRVAAEGRTPERWFLVLHGIYGSGRNWGSVARRVVEARPEWGALLVDLRQHGGSRDLPGPHTLAAAAADVDALVEHLDFHAAAVVGHSFGGKVALMYADHHGDELRQVWVMDSTLEVREPSGSAWRIIDIVRSLPQEFASRDELAAALERHGYARPLGLWLAMNLEREGDGFRWRLDWDAVEEMLRDYFRTDLWKVVETPPNQVEVHVVKATDSDALGEEDVARIEAAGRAGGRTFLHRVEGGHWINTENPDAVVRLLTERLP
jgi:esterase